MTNTTMSTQTLQRLPLYLGYLKNLRPAERSHISARAIADALGLHEVQVRKDLAAVSGGGQPRVGYNLLALIGDLDRTFSGFNTTSAALVGAGDLGRALLSAEYGLNIAAVFDVDDRTVGRVVGGQKVLGPNMIADICRQKGIRLGIIAVSGQDAPRVLERLVEGGVRAVLNYSPACLRAPRNVLVQNENMAVSVAVLSKLLMDQYSQTDLTDEGEDV